MTRVQAMQALLDGKEVFNGKNDCYYKIIDGELHIRSRNLKDYSKYCNLNEFNGYEIVEQKEKIEMVEYFTGSFINNARKDLFIHNALPHKILREFTIEV